MKGILLFIKKTIKMSDMSDTSSKKSRRQVSHEQDIQNSSVLCNVVANVVVVAADDNDDDDNIAYVNQRCSVRLKVTHACVICTQRRIFVVPNCHVCICVQRLGSLSRSTSSYSCNIE